MIDLDEYEREEELDAEAASELKDDDDELEETDGASQGICI
jgi:hypothetical protein